MARGARRRKSAPLPLPNNIMTNLKAKYLPNELTGIKNFNSKFM